MPKSSDQLITFSRPVSDGATRKWKLPKGRRALEIDEIYAQCCKCGKITKKIISKQAEGSTKVWCENCVEQRDDLKTIVCKDLRTDLRGIPGV